MTTFTHTLAPRLLAGFGTLTLLAGIGLLASRPAHTAGGPIPVSVANAPLAVFSQDSDNPARHAVGGTIYLSSTAPGTTLSGNLYSVPANKRLVIEHLSATTNVRSDANGYDIEVDTIQNASGVTTNFNEVPDAAPYSAASQSVRLYGDPNTSVYVVVYAGSKNSSDMSISFSGYLVDL